MGRKIAMPESYWKSIMQLVNEPNESAGFFIYENGSFRNEPEKVNVVYFNYNQSNNPSNVQMDPNMRNLMGEFLGGQNRFGFIDFHTHTCETIRRHGDYYDSNISNSDLEFIEEGLSRNPNYIHLVFTPSNVLKFSEETVMDNAELPIQIYRPRSETFLEDLVNKYANFDEYFNG